MEYQALQDYSTHNYRRTLVAVGTKTNPTSPNTFFEQPTFQVNELALDYSPKKVPKKKLGLFDIRGLNRKSQTALRLETAESDGATRLQRGPSPDRAPPRHPGKTDDECTSPERAQKQLNRSTSNHLGQKPSFLKAFGSTFDQSSRHSSLSMGGATILTSANLKRQNIIEEAIEYAPISTRHQIVFPFNLEKVNFDITAFEWYYHQANMLGMRVTESPVPEEESQPQSRSQSEAGSPKRLLRMNSGTKESGFKAQARKDSHTPKKHPNGIQSDHES
jgi:hypothetical protein